MGCVGFNQLYRPVPERIIDCRNVPNLGCRGVGRCHHFLLLLHCLGIAVAHVGPSGCSLATCHLSPSKLGHQTSWNLSANAHRHAGEFYWFGHGWRGV